MKNNILFLILGLSLIIFWAAMACAPAAPLKATPSPATSPPTPAIIEAAPLISPAVSPEDAKWQKIEAAARGEGKLTVYSYNLVGDIGLAVSRAFDGRYGIKMEIITGLGAGMIERLKAEKRAGQIEGDTYDSSAVNLQSLKAEGLAASVYDDLPVLKQRGVWHVEPDAGDPQDRLFMSFKITYTDPVINTKLVKPPDEPKSFQDFLAPKWKGKMSISDPLTQPAAYSLVVPLLEEGIITEEWVKKLGTQELRFFRSVPDELGALSRGEHSLGIRGVDSQTSRFVFDGAPLKHIAMKEGSLVTLNGIAAIRGSPHPNAARIFLNWFFTQEGQQVFGRAMGISALRKDVPDYRPEAVKVVPTKLIVSTPEQDLKASVLMRERWLPKLWER